MASHRVNGIRIEIEERGDRDHPALLLIRGLATQLTHWPEAFLDALVAAGLRVVVFDNRDAGLSEKFEAFGAPDVESLFKATATGEAPPAPYRVDDMAADTVGVLDALGIERAHVAGISMGGMIAQVTAARAPDRCWSLTSIMSSSGAPNLPGPTPEAMTALVSQPEDPSNRECVIAHHMETQRVIESPAYPMTESEARRYAEGGYDRGYCPEGVARQMAAILASGSRVELLASIRVPTLVIHGAEDVLIPPACGEDTARRIRGARLELVTGMGHDVTAANSPLLARLLSEHARRVGEPARGE
ncbi:MAG: alpha/beta hydrolase [Proteobacteria bacterium]|nr:alpha/beta hydrolase [Pseudomonadota bacterium]